MSTFLEGHALHILVGTVMSHGAFIVHAIRRLRKADKLDRRISKLVRWAERNDVDPGVCSRIHMLLDSETTCDYDFIDMTIPSPRH
jgi:hypothetical protein